MNTAGVALELTLELALELALAAARIVTCWEKGREMEMELLTDSA